MVWNDAVQFYNRTFNEIGDPRVGDWVMTQSPFPTLFICSLYVYVVKYLGPSLMKNREPLDIRWLMVFYNFMMVIFNFLIFYGFGIYGWFGSYSYKCQPVDYSFSPEALGMVKVCWWFYISKMVEFTDTIFFVMRKKFNQISTLHVVHHGILPMSVWFGLKFTPGGHSTFFAFINSFVHVLMYCYYGLAAIGPHMNKYLWWKKYMTRIQMIQFVMIFTHAFQLLFRDCNYPQGFAWWIGFHSVLFWFLFADFYRSTYRKAKALKAKSSDIGENAQQLKNGYTAKNGHHFSSEITNGCTNQNGLSNSNSIHSHTDDTSDLSNGYSCLSDLVEHSVDKKIN